MSSHKVEVTRVDSVELHPNADRLDLVRVGGWVCVTGRGTFQAGDICVYIPIDSVLPPEIEALLFPADSKVKLSKSRVKTIKLRGCVSQGMCVKPLDVGIWDYVKPGTDVAERLGIKKFELPVKVNTSPAKRGPKRHDNPHLPKYTDLENIKNYINVFKEGEAVVVTEKIHGTNFRAGWVPFVARTWWHKVRAWIGRNPKWEFVYGSRNVQLQSDTQKTFYDDNVYAAMVNKYNLRERLPFGRVYFGEIYGDGIQPGYNYGCATGERKVAFFEIYDCIRKAYVPPLHAEIDCMARQLPFVPILHEGPFNLEVTKLLAKGDSELAESQKVREGVVVRSAAEEASYCGRKILKAINDDYLLGKHADEEVAHDMAVA